MNAAAASIVGSGLLTGAFDVLDAMLSMSFEHESGEPVPLTEENARALLAEFPVTMQARIENDLGGVALLFTIADAARIAAIVQERDHDPAGTDLAEEDREVLREIAGPALGSGVTNLMEQFGRDVEQLEAATVDSSGAAHAGELMALMAEGAGALRFTFSNGTDFSGEGVALFSQDLQALLPEDALPSDSAVTGATVPSAAGTELSREEMSDILSGFSGGSGDIQQEQGGGQNGLPGNLDMVLDIGLIATARLGHVELPISEILNLGPGSIIEVGHLVDEPIDLLVNGKLIARGDVVVVDEKFGFRITEIVSTRARIESMR